MTSNVSSKRFWHIFFTIVLYQYITSFHTLFEVTANISRQVDYKYKFTKMKKALTNVNINTLFIKRSTVTLFNSAFLICSGVKLNSKTGSNDLCLIYLKVKYSLSDLPVLVLYDYVNTYKDL